MKYIYDISVNMQEKYLDFYEWNKSDKIVTLKKIPILKINTNDFYNIVSNDIKIDDSFLNQIYYNNKYICLFMCDDQVCVIEFNKKGNSIKRSSLVVDEELDIMENYYNLKTMTIDYELIKQQKYSFITRSEQEKINFLKKELDILSLPSDKEKIGYLYFECFGNIENDYDVALKRIKRAINSPTQINQLYRFFKFINQK